MTFVDRRRERHAEVAADAPSGWRWTDPARPDCTASTHFTTYLVPNAGSGHRRRPPSFLDGEPGLSITLTMGDRRTATGALRFARKQARWLLDDARQAGNQHPEAIREIFEDVNAAEWRVNSRATLRERSSLTQTFCADRVAEDPRDDLIDVPQARRANAAATAVLPPPRRRDRWLVADIMGQASIWQDCRRPSTNRIQAWDGRRWYRRLTRAASELAQSLRYRSTRLPRPQRDREPPIEPSDTATTPCSAAAAAFNDVVLPGFPPLPIPTVAAESIPYEYLNYLNAYRDVIFAHVRGAAAEIPHYRQLVTEGAGRPGALAGVAAAEAAWARLPADARVQIEGEPTCPVQFTWTWQDERFVNDLRLRDYLAVRLDNLVGLAMARMSHSTYPWIDRHPALTVRLVQLQVLARQGRLDEYRAPQYLALPDFEPFP